MFGRRGTLKGPAECLIALTMPDALYGLLENVAQYPLLFIFTRTLMPKGRETAREHIPTGGNIGQRIWTPAASPGAITKIAHNTLYRRRRASRLEQDAPFFAHLLATPY